jgi:hypothetical protein
MNGGNKYGKPDLRVQIEYVSNRSGNNYKEFIVNILIFCVVSSASFGAFLLFSQKSPLQTAGSAGPVAPLPSRIDMAAAQAGDTGIPRNRVHEVCVVNYQSELRKQNGVATAAQKDDPFQESRYPLLPKSPTIHLNFVDAAKFLECAMKTDINRFCDAKERNILAWQLSNYYEIRQTILGYDDEKVKRFASRFGVSPPASSNGVDWKQWYIPIKVTEREMNSALMELALKGLFTKKDFGRFSSRMPWQLSGYLENEGSSRCP